MFLEISSQLLSTREIGPLKSENLKKVRNRFNSWNYGCMSLKKEENCNKREVFKLQLAGKVDLVGKQLSLVFVDRSCSYFGILIETENRFFSENMKVIGASWDLRMARFRWTDAGIELRFNIFDGNPYLNRPNFFLGAFLSVTAEFPGKVFFGFFSVKKWKKSRFFGLVQIVRAKAILC